LPPKNESLYLVFCIWIQTIWCDFSAIVLIIL